jgi:hypothetical protein
MAHTSNSDSIFGFYFGKNKSIKASLCLEDSDKKMTIIRFGSKSPLHTSLFYLGNLAPSVFTITWPRDVKGIPEFLQGKTRTYATSEHAYQACKTADPVSARNLRLSTMKAFKRWPSRKNGQIQVPLAFSLHACLHFDDLSSTRIAMTRRRRPGA